MPFGAGRPQKPRPLNTAQWPQCTHQLACPPCLGISFGPPVCASIYEWVQTFEMHLYAGACAHARYLFLISASVRAYLCTGKCNKCFICARYNLLLGSLFSFLLLYVLTCALGIVASVHKYYFSLLYVYSCAQIEYRYILFWGGSLLISSCVASYACTCQDQVCSERCQTASSDVNKHCTEPYSAV